MKASTLIVSLTSLLALTACGSDASLGNAGSPVDTSKTGSGGSKATTGAGGSTNGGTGGSSSGTAGDSTPTGAGGAPSSGPAGGTGTGGSPNGTGGTMSGTGGAPAGDGGADACAAVSCAIGSHCVLEDVVCIQAPCPPQPTCVKDPPQGSQCTVAGDCQLVDNYCGGCYCDALPTKSSEPKCNKGMVQCLIEPCRGKTAKCSSGQCVAQ